MLKKEYFLKRKYVFKNNQETGTHLGYSIDNRFARCTGASIYSFVKNNPNRTFTIHIITAGLSDENISRFKELSIQLKINLIIYIIDTNFLDTLHLDVSIKWPISTYFRFLYPFITDNVQTIYYIDGDIICNDNCDELFSIELKDIPLAACLDNSSFTDSRCRELNLEQHTYINAGMMIININKWLELDIWTKFLELIKNRETPFKSHDQDILNIIFATKILYLDSKYNYQTWIRTLSENDITSHNAVLIHFGGHPKPWQKTWPLNKKYTSTTANIYSSYEKFTPWGNIPLDLPQDYKDRRLYASLLIKEKKYILGLKEFIIYCKEKFLYKLQ